MDSLNYTVPQYYPSVSRKPPNTDAYFRGGVWLYSHNNQDYISAIAPYYRHINFEYLIGLTIAGQWAQGGPPTLY